MELLTEKYRPTKIEDLVNPTGQNNSFILKLNKWKEDGLFSSHLLFFGPAGTGKSSSVRVILNELGISDYMVINGSDKTSVDDMRKVIDYASISPVEDKIKVVVIEEFERLSQAAQDSLKYVLETYSGWCKFIFTTNNIAKVSLPILSRCEVFNFKELDKKSFISKIISILESEKIVYNQEDITEYIRLSYPDLRKCINNITKNVLNEYVDGKKILKLETLNKEEVLSNDKYEDVLKFFKTDDILETRKLLAQNFSDDDYESFYKYMWNDLNKVSTKKEKWDEIIVKIAEYVIKQQSCAIKDLNLMSCLIELRVIINK